MASETDQLTLDFEEVQSTLELYPCIDIIKVDGDPPESYEIEYQLKGYVRDTDGSIRQGSQHRVKISLPFGYPHFPPTVKPLTSIFHPDIDPDAVRIADYWQSTPSLSELILHVGEMICCNIYNLEEPFNQEAADWFAAHLDQLPLDSLQVADITAVDDSLGALDNDTFELLGLEDEEPEPKDSQDAGPQLDLIRLRIEQKELFAASKLLNEIPASCVVADRDEIEHVIASSLRESHALMEKAEHLEDKGRLDEAMEVVEKVSDIALDAPGLDDIRLRLQQAQVMAETFSGGSVAGGAPSIPSAAGHSSGKKKKVQRVQKRSAAPSIALSGIPFKPIFAAVFIMALLTGGGVVYFKDTNSVKQAESGWQQAQSLLHKQQFRGARDSARAALESLDQILVLRGQKKELRGKLFHFLNSDDLKQGIKGLLKYKGEYLPAKVVAKLQQLEKLTIIADQTLKKGKVNKALTAYGTALKFAQQNELATQVASISQIIKNLRFEETMASARKAENAQEWANAAETYRRALEISKSLSDIKGAEEISKKLAAATFRHEMDQSKASFTESQWQETIAMLQDAKKLLEANPETVSEKERRELDRLLAGSQLYYMLSLARAAYDKRDWDTAITEYEKALNHIRKQADILTEAQNGAMGKIEKTLLLVKISREKIAAATAEKQNDLQSAMTHYLTISQLVTDSTLSKSDPDVMDIKTHISALLKKKRKALAMNKKIGWLKSNYEKIFKAAYPSSRSSELSNPKVVFLEKVHGKEIFVISCVERNGGRAFRLELRYQYNPATGKWSRHSGQ